MKRKILPAAAALLFVFLLALSGCGLFTGASDERFPSDVADGQDYAGSPESFLASQETPTTIYRRMYEEAREKDIDRSKRILELRRSDGQTYDHFAEFVEPRKRICQKCRIYRDRYFREYKSDDHQRKRIHIFRGGEDLVPVDPYYNRKIGIPLLQIARNP